MPEKKNNHFVPVFYLKLWSHNGTQVNSYLVKHRKALPVPATITDEVSKDYLYGKDGKIENILGNLEDNVGQIINRLIDSDTPRIADLSDSDCMRLKAFMSIGIHRTQWKKDRLNVMVDAVYKTQLANALAMEPNVPSLPSNWQDIVKINVNFPQMMKEIMPQLMICQRDLSLVLIPTNDETSEFITSDNPVILLNPLAEKLGYSGTGLTNAGLAMLMTIGPKYTLLAYDGTAYDIDINAFTCENINDAVCCNAINCIYYKNIQIEVIENCLNRRVETDNTPQFVEIEGETYQQFSEATAVPSMILPNAFKIKPELDLSIYNRHELGAPNKYAYTRKRSEFYFNLFEGYKLYLNKYKEICTEKIYQLIET